MIKVPGENKNILLTENFLERLAYFSFQLSQVAQTETHYYGSLMSSKLRLIITNRITWRYLQRGTNLSEAELR